MTYPDQPQHPGVPIPPAPPQPQPPVPAQPQVPAHPSAPPQYSQPPYGQLPSGYAQPGASQAPGQHGYPQQGYPQQGYAAMEPPGRKKLRTGFVVTIVVAGVVVVAGIAVAVMAALGVFSSHEAAPIIDDTPTSIPTAQAEPSDEPIEASPEPTGDSAADPSEAPLVDDSQLDLTPRDPGEPFADTSVTWKPGSPEAFAARDKFFIDQQLPMDGTLLTATTIEQRTFIARQRAFFTENAAELTPHIETIYLAMTSDACETAILNAHSVDAATYDSFMATSPLFNEILDGLVGAEREAASRNLEEVMLFGMSYVCPGDVNEWSLIYQERYGVFPKIY